MIRSISGAFGERDASHSARTIRSIAASTCARVPSSYVRTLSWTTALSGMTLGPVPACRLPTVSTAGVVAASSRETTVWSRTTIIAASTTGSTAACGMEPCAPRPCTVMRRLSAAERNGPGRVPT